MLGIAVLRFICPKTDGDSDPIIVSDTVSAIAFDDLGSLYCVIGILLLLRLLSVSHF